MASERNVGPGRPPLQQQQQQHQQQWKQNTHTHTHTHTRREKNRKEQEKQMDGGQWNEQLVGGGAYLFVVFVGDVDAVDFDDAIAGQEAGRLRRRAGVHFADELTLAHLAGVQIETESGEVGALGDAAEARRRRALRWRRRRHFPRAHTHTHTHTQRRGHRHTHTKALTKTRRRGTIPATNTGAMAGVRASANGSGRRLTVEATRRRKPISLPRHGPRFRFPPPSPTSTQLTSTQPTAHDVPPYHDRPPLLVPHAHTHTHTEKNPVKPSKTRLISDLVLVQSSDDLIWCHADIRPFLSRWLVAVR